MEPGSRAILFPESDIITAPGPLQVGLGPISSEAEMAQIHLLQIL